MTSRLYTVRNYTEKHLYNRDAPSEISEYMNSSRDGILPKNINKSYQPSPKQGTTSEYENKILKALKMNRPQSAQRMSRTNEVSQSAQKLPTNELLPNIPRPQSNSHRLRSNTNTATNVHGETVDTNKIMGSKSK